MIINTNTRQIYIGQSINIERRWNQHCRMCNKTSYIDKAIQKYKKENFVLKIICKLENNKTLLNEMEKYYIWKYNTYNDIFHYNLTPGGDFNPMYVPEIVDKVSGCNNVNFGQKRNLKIRKKISKAQSGKNNNMYGQHHTKEARKKMSDNHADFSGNKHPRAKYTLWDSACCLYMKNLMYQNNRAPNPSKCFKFKYKGYKLPIGYFYDFVTCEILNNIILEGNN